MCRSTLLVLSLSLAYGTGCDDLTKHSKSSTPQFDKFEAAWDTGVFSHDLKVTHGYDFALTDVELAFKFYQEEGGVWGPVSNLVSASRKGYL